MSLPLDATCYMACEILYKYSYEYSIADVEFTNYLRNSMKELNYPAITNYDTFLRYMKSALRLHKFMQTPEGHETYIGDWNTEFDPDDINVIKS
jgi:hypothetical protein